MALTGKLRNLTLQRTLIAIELGTERLELRDQI